MSVRSPYVLLKINRLLRNHSVKCLAVMAADFLRMRHLSVRFDPFLGCNLRCQMCHFSSPEYQDHKAEILSEEAYERVAKLLFSKAIQVILGTGAEPTVHPKLPQMVRIAKEKGVPFVGISTNGQLLTEPLCRALVEAGLDEVTISMHGVQRETYERLQPPAKYDKLHAALGHLTDLARTTGRKFSVRVNFTVNPDNHQELGQFFEVFGHYKIDTLQVRKIFDLGDTAYKLRDLDPYLQTLERIRLDLAEACKRQGTTLLCPSFVRTSSTPDQDLSAILLPLVHRHVTPSLVWRQDFDWKNETYETYLKRIGWYRDLWRMATTRGSRILQEIPNRNRSLGYDVNA